MTFSISYSNSLKWLFWLLGLGPRWSRAVVEPAVVRVRMGWGFSTVVPRTSIAAVTRYEGTVFTWGVHGWRGRWLVNGSSKGVVVVDIAPRARAYVLGIPVRLRQLAVSLDEPETFINLLAVQVGS